jgi:serine phosphatase RsbU (regulator of sigma subunit)
MFSKLRFQLLSAFSFFSLIIVCVVFLNFLYLKQKKEIEEIHQVIQTINTNILDHSITIHDFFAYDTKNPTFFITGQSDYLNKHHEKLNIIRTEVKHLRNIKEVGKLGIDEKINMIDNELDTYEKYLDLIVDMIIKRGYKDYGLEGEMREYAHKLEYIKTIDIAKVLMLRRHEKDYIIRNEEKYIQKLTRLSQSFKEEIANNNSITKQDKDSAIVFLENYTNHFNLIVELDRQIGIKNNTALSHKIHLQGDKIISIFNHISTNTLIKKQNASKRLKINHLIIMTLFISLSFTLSIYLSKRITKNLAILSTNISDFVNNNFDENVGNNLPKNYPEDEVGSLIDSYTILRTEILSLINNLQLKVEQRTKAIQCQKERIEQQKEEIETQRDELFSQNQLIDFQRKKTEQQNNDIISSIQYAQLIQQALMPSQETLDRYFKDNFVLYKPKDILSGDFYWAKKIKNKNYNITVIAAVDCTGHGVPGALMSMLGVAFLNEIILKKEVKKASHILDKLREKVIESFQNHNNNSITNDGMDVALVLIDHNTNKMHYTGANRPLYIIRDHMLKVIDGDKMPIGNHGFSNGNFTNQIIDIQKNDTIYLFSDGYADQFGGPKNKKFKRDRLKNLLLDVCEMPMVLQKKAIEKEHNSWRNKNRQTDDILILGVKF